MADLILSPGAIADKLHALFSPVYESWKVAGAKASQKLCNEAKGKNATQILSADLKELGRYVICGDDRATRIELGLLVDVLSALQAKGDARAQAYAADALAQEMGIDHVQNKGSRLVPSPDAMDLPLSLRINLDAEELKLHVKPTAMLRDIFIEYIHATVLRDGMLTSDEIAHAKQVEEILVALTERPKA